MEKIKISAVSYLNTLPFVYGIKNSGFISDYELKLEIPSECAKSFLSKSADIALIPVGALNHLNSFQLMNDYCIGSNGNVRTVILLSKVPLKSIKTIHLDYHSMTSVNLVKILAKHYWNIHPEWINLDKSTETNMTQLESLVAIGDKTFLLEKEFPYIYDLAAEWMKFKGLPFVFACWVAQDNVSSETIQKVTKALEWGVNNKRKAIDNLFDIQKFPSVNIEEYLEKNIDFNFDIRKHEALEMFLEYLREEV